MLNQQNSDRGQANKGEKRSIQPDVALYIAANLPATARNIALWRDYIAGTSGTFVNRDARRVQTPGFHIRICGQCTKHSFQFSHNSHNQVLCAIFLFFKQTLIF